VFWLSDLPELVGINAESIPRFSLGIEDVPGGSDLPIDPSLPDWRGHLLNQNQDDELLMRPESVEYRTENSVGITIKIGDFFHFRFFCVVSASATGVDFYFF
jgi:hypothetical protein